MTNQINDNDVIEVLEDGTIYYFDLDVCEQEADSVIESLAEKQYTVTNYDFHATIFNLFLKSIYILSEAGWHPEELLEEVLIHTNGLEEDED